MKVFVPAMGRINTSNRDGSEIRFAEVAKRWGSFGAKFHILLPEREIQILKSQGVDHVTLDVVRDVTDSQRDSIFNVFIIYATRMVFSLFRRYPQNIDLIYVPSDFLVDVIPGLLCKVCNLHAQLVVCCFLLAPNPLKGYENVFSNRFVFPSLRGIIYYSTQLVSILAIKLAKGKILVLNESDRLRLCDIGVDSKNVVTVSMGVDTMEFERVQPEGRVQGYDAIFVGRLHEQKGLPDLIAIWKLVCQRRPGSRLCIVGGGALRWFKWLTTKLKANRLENHVDVLGFKFGEEKIRLLKAARCSVMPSHYESWGMTAVEAMACGLPVVAYDIPVFREVFSDVMIRVPFEDYEAFANEVVRLLEDKEHWIDFSKRSKELSINFDWKKIAEKEWRLISRGFEDIELV